MNHLRIATRNSPLALWQANHIAQTLCQHHPELTVKLIPIMTTGDQLLQTDLTKIGGKGLFTKELERALLDNQADIAVHSMKDVPHQFPAGLVTVVVGERGAALDCLVSQQYASLAALPAGAVVGTSSLRRQCQLLAHRPDLQVKLLRGNVNTRLAKLAAGEYDAIILAQVGLERLGLAQQITEILTPELMLPGAGQGALGVEYLENNKQLAALLAPLVHDATQACLQAERTLTARLGGSCQVPVGAYAEWLNATDIRIRGLVACPQTNQCITAEAIGPASGQLGTAVAQVLLAQGADKILAQWGLVP